MRETSHVAVLGAGLIGASWAALFLASGRSVAVHDPAPDVGDRLRRTIGTAWPVLTALGLTEHGNPDAVTVHATAAAAVAGAGFVQESVPERLPLKHALFAEIEDALEPDAVVASSASGLTLGQMQDGWRDPARFVLGHPFNPPHLIPLVEVMGNGRTDPDAVETAEAVYADLGKVTIRVEREIPGHVANRLQAALWREAIHLVASGVASVADVDRAVRAGPGLRWAAMGPTTLFHLGAGDGGLAAFVEHFRDTFHGWWDGLGDPRLDEATAARLVEGVEAAAAGRDTAALAAERDALILAMLTATRELRSTGRTFD